MVGRSGGEVTKHSAAMLPPKGDKINKPKKLSIGSSKVPVAAESGEIRITSKRPKTIGGFTRPKTIGGFTRPKTIGGFTRPKTIGGFTRPKTIGGFTKHDQDAFCRPVEHCGSGQYIKQRRVGTGSAHNKSLTQSPTLESKRFAYGFEKLNQATCNLGNYGGGSKFFDLNEHDVSSVGEQYVDQGAVKEGSTQNKSFQKSKDKRKVESENLVEETLNPGLAGARSKKYYEKPNVPLATDQYADQGKGKALKKGKKIIGNVSFGAPSLSEQAGHVSFRAASPSEQVNYEALKTSVKALKEETRMLRIQMQAEAEISGQINEENTMLLDELRLKWPPSVVAKFEAKNPSR